MEFHKFDIEGDGMVLFNYLLIIINYTAGWMSKVVLLPVMKACFTYSMHDKEIRMLLASKSLASMVCLQKIKT